MPTNPSNGSLRARDLFEPTIRGIELELGVPIWSRLNGIDFPSFTKLIDELETAVEKKCNGQPLTAIAATKQTRRRHCRARRRKLQDYNYRTINVNIIRIRRQGG